MVKSVSFIVGVSIAFFVIAVLAAHTVINLFADVRWYESVAVVVVFNIITAGISKALK